MEPQEKMTTQEFIIDRLHDIQRKAEANNYTDALASIKEVKSADAKNIYLIALEKQITKLTDISLSPENRAEIIKSLPAMIERAINDLQRRASQVKPEDQKKEQKEAALEKLKSQYFQRADDYVSKQEYQRALEEIRRIYIIEPGNIVAKEYEQKIEQLAALHARSEKPEEPKVGAEVKTEPTAEPVKEKYVLEEEPKKSKLPIIAAAAVVVIAVGVWFVLSQKTEEGTADKKITEQRITSQESEPPQLPTTTTSTPQTGKEQSEATDLSKSASKAGGKTQPETKLSEKKETAPTAKPAPTTTQPTTPAQQPVKQPTTQTQTTQPAQKEPVPSATQPTQPPAEQPKPAESTPAPVPFVAVESQPEIIKREPAKYPEIAIKMGIEGRVTVEVTVDPQGKPIQARVVRSTSDIFDEAAIEAVMKYQFKPAMMSTGPVTAKVYVPISFTLKK